MTFSAPAYCSQCNRTYRFMDTMSSLCPRCSEAREGTVELKRDEDRRPEAMRAGAAPSPPPFPRIDVPRKSAADVRSCWSIASNGSRAQASPPTITPGFSGTASTAAGPGSRTGKRDADKVA
jgi:hypothetical protein